MQEIEKIIDDKVHLFLQKIASEYSLDAKLVTEQWQTFAGAESSEKKKNNKKSAYQNFFTQKRIQYKKMNSSLSFGELSSLISQEWSKLQPAEKDNYTHQFPVYEKEIKFTFEELNQKKMSELKELCENVGIKKSGNKSELINNLLGQESKKTIQNVPKTIKNDVPDNSIEILVSKTDQKRSNIEVKMPESDMPIDEDYNFDDMKSDAFDSESENTIQDDEEEEDLFDD